MADDDAELERWRAEAAAKLKPGAIERLTLLRDRALIRARLHADMDMASVKAVPISDEVIQQIAKVAHVPPAATGQLRVSLECTCEVYTAEHPGTNWTAKDRQSLLKIAAALNAMTPGAEKFLRAAGVDIEVLRSGVESACAALDPLAPRKTGPDNYPLRLFNGRIQRDISEAGGRRLGHRAMQQVMELLGHAVKWTTLRRVREGVPS